MLRHWHSVELGISFELGLTSAARFTSEMWVWFCVSFLVFINRFSFRLQRARTFARSQPNLLSLLDDLDSPDSTTPSDSSPVIDKLPAMAALRSALSNPNLLDEEAHLNGVDSFNEKVCTFQFLFWLMLYLCCLTVYCF